MSNVMIVNHKISPAEFMSQSNWLDKMCHAYINHIDPLVVISMVDIDYLDDDNDMFTDEYWSQFASRVREFPHHTWIMIGSHIIAHYPVGCVDCGDDDVISGLNISLSSFACWFAVDVLGRRWLEVESIIMESAANCSMYADVLIGGRWPEAEPIILTDADAALDYAAYAIKGRWPEAEPIILTDAYYAAAYASEVLGRRWPEAESIILTDAGSAWAYAIDVVKGRWPEAEYIIRTDDFYWSKYISSYPEVLSS